MKKIRLGTRGSKLALVQSQFVSRQLREKFPEMEIEIKVIKTTGDKILDAPLSKIGDKGLFTKEIEKELIEGTIDLAVHSMKDMPTMLPDGLKIGAVTERLNPRDVFISKKGLKLADLKPGNTIATSSLRRKAQLLSYKPGLNIIDIRGNVISRLRKMRENPDIDGIVLAFAGVSRLDMEESITEIIDDGIIIPPVGQAAIAIEIREHDTDIEEIVMRINNSDSATAIECEREFLRQLHGGCQVPIAGYARITGTKIHLTGMVASLDGQRVYRKTMSDAIENHRSLGRDLAETLLKQGAKIILEEIYGHAL